MKHKILGLVVFLFAFMSSHLALANWGCDHGLKSMIESLNLDSSQKDKIRPIIDQFITTAKDKGEQIRTISEQIKDQMKSGTMEQDAVNSLVDKKVQLIGEIMKAKISAKAQISAILNDKQKAELSSMMQKKEEKIAEKYKSCQD